MSQSIGIEYAHPTEVCKSDKKCPQMKGKFLFGK